MEASLIRLHGPLSMGPLPALPAAPSPAPVLAQDVFSAVQRRQAAAGATRG